MVAGFWEPIIAPVMTGGAITGPLSRGGRPRGARALGLAPRPSAIGATGGPMAPFVAVSAVY